MIFKLIFLTFLSIAAVSQQEIKPADVQRMRGYLVQLIGEEGIEKGLKFFYFDIKSIQTCGIGMTQNIDQMKEKYENVDQWTRQKIVQVSLKQIVPYLQNYTRFCRYYVENFDQHPNYVQEIILDIFYQNGPAANHVFKNTLQFIREKKYARAGMFLREVSTVNLYRNHRRAEKLLMGEKSKANQYYDFQVKDKNTSIQQIDQTIIEAGIIL